MIKEIIQQVTDSSVYTQWKSEHEKAYLTHLFVMGAADKKNGWQVGFVEDNKVTSFLVEDEVTKQPTDDAFTKPGDEIIELIIDDDTLDVDDAITIAKKEQEAKYSNDFPQNIISILQVIDDVTMWNITFLTLTFKTLNIRVNAKTGEVVKADMVSLFEFDNKNFQQ